MEILIAVVATFLLPICLGLMRLVGCKEKKIAIVTVGNINVIMRSAHVYCYEEDIGMEELEQEVKDLEEFYDSVFVIGKLDRLRC